MSALRRTNVRTIGNCASPADVSPPVIQCVRLAGEKRTSRRVPSSRHLGGNAAQLRQSDPTLYPARSGTEGLLPLDRCYSILARADSSCRELAPWVVPCWRLVRTVPSSAASFGSMRATQSSWCWRLHRPTRRRKGAKARRWFHPQQDLEIANPAAYSLTVFANRAAHAQQICQGRTIAKGSSSDVWRLSKIGGGLFTRVLVRHNVFFRQ